MIRTGPLCFVVSRTIRTPTIPRARIRCRRWQSTAPDGDTQKPSGGRFRKMWKSVTRIAMPASLGFLVIAALDFYHVTHPTEPDREHALKMLRERGVRPTGEELQLATPRQQLALNMVPYRILSRAWGAVNEIKLPDWAREPIYKAWTKAFNCNLEEMKYPLKHYENLSEFFSRPLKEGSRPIDLDRRAIVSPVDGEVIVHGMVDPGNPVPLLEQIKGIRYRLDEFLGFLPSVARNKDPKGDRLYYIVIYLAPGDYHRIHSPVDWQIQERIHFPGKLYPVAPWAVKLVPSLFSQNERVVLKGEWEHGFYSLTAVGALNVGSILVNMERSLKTNVSGQGNYLGKPHYRLYNPPFASKKGDEVAQFKLGSTVVLVFQAPQSFSFLQKPGQSVRMGLPFGVIGKKS